ncbi:GDSL-type esterase/lipase family protein [Ideonella sp. DXS29W]|uniref:GDSL-type esterase/lipase family protein n=1 Tax=Ideonella lacteola TaxID=2984193 RepID=A0ABU9BZ54_9BURK
MTSTSPSLARCIALASGLASSLALSTTAWALDDRTLFDGQPGTGLRVTILDHEGQAPLGNEPLVVPKPAKPQVPASEVRALRNGAAIALHYKEAWYAAIRFESETPIDLSGYLAQGTLEFDVRSDDLAHSGLNISVGCGPDCHRKVNRVVPSRSLAGRGWQHWSFSMQCFQREGSDFRQVKQPFTLETSGTGHVELARVVFKPQGTPNTPCPDYRTESITPAPLEEVWSVEWWQPRHDKKLAEIQQRRQANEPIELVFIGDSITQGWENEGRPVWERHFARFNALNLGFGGDRTENVLWRLQHGEIDGLKPKAVVLMIGTNNTGHRQEDPQTTAAGVRALLGEIARRMPGTPVLLLAVFPRDEKPGTPMRRINEQLNQHLAALADGRQVQFLDIGRSLMNPDGTLSRDVMPDWLHLSEKGYGLWADAMRPTLDRLMAQPR